VRATLVLCLALCGCASIGSGCPPGLEPVTTADLYFGRNVGAQEGVTDADWQRFVETDIAPRFPDGFTISDAVGAWQGNDGKPVRERTKRLSIVLKGGDQPKLEALRAVYKARFRQDSVMLVETAGCAGF
jgi:hypothetical protein